METGIAIRTAARGVWFELRCWACEILISWALKASPKGYVPSFVQAVVDAKKEKL